MGNPPYSNGQQSDNDNNANVAYPNLDQRIEDTYAHSSKASLSKGFYDSYIRAIRWASDRVGKSGVIGYVTNAGFLEASTTDGLRKCLAEEFSSIYVFHLRGNQRTSGELSRKEGGKIFGSGSRAPIAITMFIKNPEAEKSGQIFWHDIGDYLSQFDKLAIISEFGGTSGISAAKGWESLHPDEHHDWVKQRDESFGEFITLGAKRGNEKGAIFEDYTLGVYTSRDAWGINGSKSQLSEQMARFISFYNDQTERLHPKGAAPKIRDPRNIVAFLAGQEAVLNRAQIEKTSAKLEEWCRVLKFDDGK